MLDFILTTLEFYLSLACFCYCCCSCLFSLFWYTVSLWMSGCPGPLCRPGWHQTQRSTYLCLLNAGIKGMCHHNLGWCWNFNLTRWIDSCLISDIKLWTEYYDILIIAFKFRGKFRNILSEISNFLSRNIEEST